MVNSVSPVTGSSSGGRSSGWIRSPVSRLSRSGESFEIVSAWHLAVAASERWDASHGGTEEGLEALRVIRERRDAGLATLTDELETEAAALQAELAEWSAAAGAAVARATLERAAGVGFLPAEETP